MYFEILDSVIMRLMMMNLSLIIDLEYFYFGPSILGIYILVPGLYENYNSVPDSSIQNLGWFMGENLVWLCIYSLVLQF